MRRPAFLLVMAFLGLSAFWFAQSDFETSLHATRHGKAYWYSAAQGGFETLTGIPMDSLACQNCHAPTRADGTPIDPATYEPDCSDCHDFAQGTAVASSVCLGCHGRQGAEITLSSHPTLGPLFTDVHRDEAGMECTDCHTQNEMHGNGTEHQTMFDEGAMETACENDGCHPTSTLPEYTAHTIHADKVYCTSCHAKTVIACYNCHFETELAIDKKRFYGPPPLNGFAFLVRDERRGMVSTATFQSLTYQDTTFYAIGPFGPHTISREARACTDCHNSEIVRTYNSTGQIPVVQWDGVQGKLVNTKGVIPIPPDWQEALLFDFVTFSGGASDPIASPLDPTQWTFKKSGADLSQMLFTAPLSADQMAKLSIEVGTAADAPPEIPGRVELLPNYPNPFNPATTIEFYLHQPEDVILTLYDMRGQEVRTVLPLRRLSPGPHRVTLDARGLASGIYVYRLESADFALARTMTLLK